VQCQADPSQQQISAKESGQTIIKDILESIDKIANEQAYLQIEVIWIPGHAEIEGNECADMEAKKAATDSTLSSTDKYKPLKSARMRYIKAAAKK
jgi:ribonuclease HI